MSFLGQSAQSFTFGPGKRQSNLYQQNRHQYDFLNPEQRKDLHLVDREWVPEGKVFYPEENKEEVKRIEHAVKEVKKEIQRQEEAAQQSKLHA